SVNDVPVCGAPPSTVYVVVATPDSASTGISVTATLLFVQLFDSPVIPVLGGVRSMLTATVAFLVLPALSGTDARAGRPAPSAVIVLSPGLVAGSTPETASSAVQWIGTSPLYQPPLPLGGGAVAAPVSVGAVVSTLMPSTVVVAVLPALSVAVPVCD